MKREDFSKAFKNNPREALRDLFAKYGEKGFEFHPVFRPIISLEKGNEQQALAIRIVGSKVECLLETGLWVGINPPEQTRCCTDPEVFESLIKAHDIFED